MTLSGVAMLEQVAVTGRLRRVPKSRVKPKNAVVHFSPPYQLGLPLLCVKSAYWCWYICCGPSWTEYGGCRALLSARLHLQVARHVRIAPRRVQQGSGVLTALLFQARSLDGGRNASGRVKIESRAGRMKPVDIPCWARS